MFLRRTRFSFSVYINTIFTVKCRVIREEFFWKFMRKNNGKKDSSKENRKREPDEKTGKRQKTEHDGNRHRK